MRALLDTAAFIYTAKSPERLSRRATSVIENPENVLDMSSVSLVEIAIKSGRSKLTFPIDVVREALEHLNVRILSFTAEHGFELFSLPRHHHDPFDRQIIAQALFEEIPIVSPDETFRLYKGLKIFW